MIKVNLFCKFFITIIWTSSIYNAAIKKPKKNVQKVFTFNTVRPLEYIVFLREIDGKRYVDIVGYKGKKKGKIAGIRYFALESEVEEGTKFKYISDFTLVRTILQDIRDYAFSYDGKTNIEKLLGIK